MSKKKHRRHIERLIQGLTDRPFSVVLNNNGHFQVSIDALERKFYTSSTPSDHRAPMNLISTIRQQFKLQGIQP